MHTHLIAILKTFVMPIARGFGTSATRIYHYLRHRPRTALLVGVVLIAGLIGMSFLFKTPAPENPQATRAVSLIRVGDQSTSEPLSVIGEIRSVREAFVSPDSSGTVSVVYKALGDSVSAGTPIAALKNDRERAAVTQAEVALAKARAGATISGIGVGTATNSLETAKTNALTAVQSARSTITDAILRQTDEVFSNPTNDNRNLIVTVPAFNLVQATTKKRGDVQVILKEYPTATTPATTQGIIDVIERELQNVSIVRDYLDTLSQTLAKGIAAGSVSESDLAAYRSQTNTSLSAVTALETSLSAAKQNLTSAEAGVSIANQQNTDIGGENADVIAARATLQNAQIALDRTIMRAPIAGVINRLDINIGDFVGAGSQVAYITNESGLEIVAYVGSRDIGDIVRGAKVTIEGTTAGGTIARVGTALDPATKKAEIRISLPPQSKFVSGQSVTVAIERRVTAAEVGKPIFLPITSVKLTPEGAEIFTVSSENKLEAHAVTLGRLEGSRIQILTGFEANWSIVEDARGLAAGETVIVNQ